jgi:hypothetical protein
MSTKENDSTVLQLSMAAKMDDATRARTLSLTQSEQFDVLLMDDDDASKVSEELADHYVDELQALNTALCFLCSINADADQVEMFLKHHPEALLLEGTCMLPEDSAVFILRQQMRRCQCKGMCNLNRVRLLGLLNSGFEKYQSLRTGRDADSSKSWNCYFARLVQMEHEIRRLRRDELSMRNTLLETAFELRSYRDELKEAYRQAEAEMASKSTALGMLACARPRVSGPNYTSHRNVLEYQVGVASINLKSVEREHTAMLHRIREGRRAQFGILKRAFQGCKRHEICSLKTPQATIRHPENLSSEGPPSAHSTSGSSSA